MNDEGWSGDLLYRIAGLGIDRGAFVRQAVGSPGDGLERVDHFVEECLLLRRQGRAQGRLDIEDGLEARASKFLHHPIGEVRAEERLVDPDRNRQLLFGGGSGSADRGEDVRGLTGAGAEQKLPLNVTWVNLSTGRSGSATLKPRPDLNPAGPTTLTVIADTGSGSIMSTIFGQVTTTDKQCQFMPTIGSTVVP